MGGVSRITDQERQTLARYDALVDAAPMTAEDYRLTDFVEALLFPELAKKREKRNAKAARQKAEKQAAGTWEQHLDRQRQYYQEHQAEIAARKAAYYQQHQAEIAAKQKAYRQRRAIAAAAAMA